MHNTSRIAGWVERSPKHGLLRLVAHVQHHGRKGITAISRKLNVRQRTHRRQVAWEAHEAHLIVASVPTITPRGALEKVSLSNFFRSVRPARFPSAVEPFSSDLQHATPSLKRLKASNKSPTELSWAWHCTQTRVWLASTEKMQLSSWQQEGGSVYVHSEPALELHRTQLSAPQQCCTEFKHTMCDRKKCVQASCMGTASLTAICR